MSRRERLKNTILSRVDIDPVSGCWIWTGPTSGEGRGGGYGRFYCDGGTFATHIVMWIVENGPIPRRKQLDHDCKPIPNRLCCNPEHLKLVTHKQNQKLRDKRLKTRATVEVQERDAA